MCTHIETLSTISSGVERVVCESCGNLSIRFHSTLTGPVARERFARPADDLEANQNLTGTERDVTASPTARYGFGTPDKPETGFVAHRPQRTLSLRSYSWQTAF